MKLTSLFFPLNFYFYDYSNEHLQNTPILKPPDISLYYIYYGVYTWGYFSNK